MVEQKEDVRQTAEYWQWIHDVDAAISEAHTHTANDPSLKPKITAALDEVVGDMRHYAHRKGNAYDESIHLMVAAHVIGDRPLIERSEKLVKRGTEFDNTLKSKDADPDAVLQSLRERTQVALEAKTRVIPTGITSGARERA